MGTRARGGEEREEEGVQMQKGEGAEEREREKEGANRRKRAIGRERKQKIMAGDPFRRGGTGSIIESDQNLLSVGWTPRVYKCRERKGRGRRRGFSTKNNVERVKNVVTQVG